MNSFRWTLGRLRWASGAWEAVGGHRRLLGRLWWRE